MKKLLSMLGAITLIGTASTSVIACGGGRETPTPPSPIRTDLSTIITTTNLGKIIMSRTTPTKEELLTAIKNNNNPSANDLTIGDFDFKQGTTPSPTTATIVGVNNYKGEVTLTYTKDTRTDLSTIITTLTGLDITADSTKIYNDLWVRKILKANEFKNLKTNTGYKTFMYRTSNSTDTKDIKNLNQEPGDIYVILEVSKDRGINCFGKTPRLKVTLK